MQTALIPANDGFWTFCPFTNNYSQKGICAFCYRKTQLLHLHYGKLRQLFVNIVHR